MPAKNTRRPTGLDIQGDFAAHIEASQRAHEWAAKCIACREAGKHFEAERARQKARHWLKKAMALEVQPADPPITGGRA